MKKILSIVLIFGIFLSCYGKFYDKPYPPRKILLQTDNVLKIAENAKNLEIVVAPEALPITVFAAQELQDFLQKVLAADIPIVNQPTPEKISWIIGINEWSCKVGITSRDMVPESFRILRKNKKIYIAGTDGQLVSMTNHPKKRPVSVKKALEDGIWMQYHAHATLFGVYDFLERFAGVRFYFPGKHGTVVPRKKQLELPGIDIFDRPDLQMRIADIYYGSGDDTKNKKSNANAKMPLYVTPERNLAAWRYRMSTDTFSTMHGLNKLWFSERFGSQHPEYFSLREDKDRIIDRKKYGVFAPQVCSSSQIAEEIFLDAKAALSGLPPSSRGISAIAWHPATIQKNIINLSYNDGMYFCRCTKCLPFYQPQNPKNTSTFLWKFQAGIARRLQQEKVPGYVSSLAYTTTLEVPDIPLPDNLVVDLSLNRGAYTFVRSEQNREYQLRLVREWHEKIGPDRLYFSSYLGKLGAQLIPTLPDFCHRAIGQFYSRLNKYTNIGFMMNGGSENYFFNYLNRYLFFRMTWDKNCNWENILTEHFQLMFRKSAPILENIYNELEDTWVGNIAGKFTESNVGSIPVVPSDRDIWQKIYSPEFLQKLSAKFDAAEKTSQDDPEVLERIRFIRRQLLLPMQQYSATFLARSGDILGLRITLPTVQQPVKLDGVLNETAWKQASLITLRAFKPEPGQLYPATNALIMEDAQNLYLGIRLKEPDAKLLAATPCRPHNDRDLWRDNLVEIFLKPEKSGDNFYQIMVNLKGSTGNMKIRSTGRTFTPDYSWDSGVRAAAKPTADGVNLEIMIPKQNIPGLAQNNFTFNLIRGRRIDGKCLSMSWSPFLKVRYHEPDAFGIIERKSEFPNLIKDYDFSTFISTRGTKPSPWYCNKNLWNTPCIALDEEFSVSGSKSLRLTQTKTAGKYVSVMQSLPTLKPNTRYRISFYLKTKDIQVYAKTGGAGVGIRDNGNHWFPYNRIRGTNDWHYLSFDYTTSEHANSPKNHVAIQCALVSVQPGGIAWFDSIRVEELGSAWSTH